MAVFKYDWYTLFMVISVNRQNQESVVNFALRTDKRLGPFDEDYLA